MATALVTYELGAGLGHLTPLISVAERLSSAHRIVFAVPKPQGASDLVAAAIPRAHVRPTVVWAPVIPDAAKIVTHSLADAIHLFGLFDAAILRRKVASCARILDEVRPQVVISDFAPAMRLAAAATGCPVVVVGYGYSVPPAGRLLPPLRPWDNEVPALSRAHEFAILAAVNEVCAARPGARPIDHLADVFHGDKTFVCTIPAFDPYRRARKEPTHAPIHIPEFGPGPPPSERAGPDVFVYFPGAHPRASDIIAGLVELELHAELYTPGIAGTPTQGGGRLKFLDRPAAYAQVLPQARTIIHHGGLGSSLAGLSAATPQFAFPMYTEHVINARAVASLGAGTLLPGKRPFDPAVFRQRLQALLTDKSLHEAAQKAARAVESIRLKPSLGTIAAACEEHLAEA